ncbi:MAG: VWA domain-containing protein [Tepidibacter sp.]|jgi:hypothetical protein|uniref:VWA domain-containing protein n=1 Tax=Tepidibacter sp. TaxID=2529387 RepID=UPI0025F8BE93|nr:VWA domain-containing protein [Tepidibacter sp.]MCT4509438.1 VWA domain-containing protein [Tepidibacter sp.]
MRSSKFEITKKNYRRLVSIVLVIFNILLFIPNNVFLQEAYGDTNNSKEAPLKLIRTIDKDRYKANEEITINYKVQPDPIPKSEIIPDSYLQQKEIVLAIDRSSSMGMHLSGNKTRLDVARNATKMFISKFKDDKRVKVAIVSYSHYANDVCNLLKTSDTNERQKLVESLYRLGYPGGTVTEEGLRKAYHKFSNDKNTRKYIILLADGVSKHRYPQSRKDGKPYFGNGKYRVDYTIGRGSRGNEQFHNELSKKVIGDKIDSFMIAFTKDAARGSKLKPLANIYKGSYSVALDENGLNEVAEELAEQIKSDLPIKNIQFNETFPQGIVPVEASKGLVIQGQTIKGNIGSVLYKLNEQTKQFEANPINFSIKLRANKAGDYNLDSQNSYIEYKDINENNKRKMFPQKTIAVEKKKLTKIDIKVRDTSGDINQFNITSENYNKKVEKILNPSIVLQGDSYADISVEGEDTNFFEYQFIRNSKIPTSNWQSIDLNSETINKDVIKEKQGYLNKRSYDVSHGIVAGSGTSIKEANKQFWSQRDKVFKNPLTSTEYMSASYSTSKQNYGRWEEYTKQDGTKAKIWKTNSIFLDNMMIDMNYKEASKFWGYIKVDNTGDYKFGAHSDDGCRGYITANKETKEFVNMFVLQSRNPYLRTNNNVYHLEADKYYPIYLEYFNWGGWADFELKYSKNNGTWNKVPQNWFYPSKDNSPAEHSTTIFTGNKGVKFPSESGDYYIAFRTGKDGNVTREGTYGPFTVEGKTQLTISKEIIGGNKVQEKNNFILEYTVNPPTKIDAIGSFMENGEYKDRIYLTNVKIIDEYPQNIENDLSSGQKIIKYINNIEYTKSIENGKTVYKYTGNPIKVRVNLNAKKAGNYVLSEDNKSKITFTNFNQRTNREQEFAPINIEVVEMEANLITGMLINGKFQSNNDLDLVKGFDIDLGIKIENIKKQDIVLEIKDKNKINIFKDKVKIYEGIDFSNPLSNINIRTQGNTVKIETSNIEEKKNYIIIYNVEALRDSSIGYSNINIKVNSQSQTQKEVAHRINIVPLPNLE